MAGAPINNQNRKGKTGQKYNLSAPRLTCGKCSAREYCPVAANDDTPCAFIKRIRKYKLDTVEDIKAVRKAMLLDTLAQLTVMSMVTESTGISDKNMITFRKNLLDQLAGLERDEFDQELKKNTKRSGGGLFASLIEQVKELPDPDVIEADFEVINGKIGVKTEVGGSNS